MARMLYKEFRRLAITAKQEKRKFNSEICLVRKAMAENYRRNKKNIFVQEKTRRIKFD